jgi:hypothetical protein
MRETAAVRITSASITEGVSYCQEVERRRKYWLQTKKVSADGHGVSDFSQAIIFQAISLGSTNRAFCPQVLK